MKGKRRGYFSLNCGRPVDEKRYGFADCIKVKRPVSTTLVRFLVVYEPLYQERTAFSLIYQRNRCS